MGKGQLSCGLASLRSEPRALSGPQDQRKGGEGCTMSGNIPYRWPETSTLLPGRASSSLMCMVSAPAFAGGF